MDWKKRLLEHKIFWVVLAFVFILPIVGLVSQDNSEELTGNVAGKAIQTISLLKEGSDIFFEVKNVDGLNTVTLNALEDVKNVRILIEEVSDVNWDFEGKVYSMFKVSSVDADKFSNLVIILRVNEADLKDKNLKKEELKLYHDGKELDLELTKIENNFVNYKVIAESMGEFVIGKEVVVEKEPVVEEPLSEPELEQPTPLPVIEEDVSEEQVEPVVEEVESKGFFTGIKDFFVELFS